MKASPTIWLAFIENRRCLIITKCLIPRSYINDNRINFNHIWIFAECGRKRTRKLSLYVKRHKQQTIMVHRYQRVKSTKLGCVESIQNQIDKR